ncbi:MAG TPA: response regulator [Polaromonas sp.]|nr:response regulator [Polaromonas sp.]
MQHTSLAQYMQTQRDLYASTLPDKIAALEDALRQLSAGGRAGGDALAQAHKLAGSGGTFGLPAISEAASGIEKILLHNAGRLDALDDANHQALADGVRALKTALIHGTQANPAVPAFRATDSGQPPGDTRTSHRSSRLVHIIEPDQRVAVELAAHLDRAGYRSRTFDRLLTPAPVPAEAAPAALLVNMAFSADPLLAQARATSTTMDSSGIPVILISGGTDFQTRLEAVRAGAIGYFPKPLEMQALTSLLDKVTSGEPARPYRVLIVEDDEALATFYASVLQSASIETAVVTDPSRVMKQLVDFQPDLITCDIYMPRCNGIELAALIRQQQSFVRIPIVFLSTETSLDKQAQALKQGGDDFIIKPVEPATLISAAQSRARRYRSLLEAEDTLRISEERFRLVFETSLDAFIQCLADGTVISANQAACTMFRMSEQEIRAAGIAHMVQSHDPRLAAMLLQNNASGKFRGELDCVRGDGTCFPVEVSSSRHVDRSGNLQVSVILRDISERKTAEQQIMQLNAELETRVERRTAELSAANQELQAFSHSLAHDLRQPYIAINGLTSLLEKAIATGESERSKNYLDRIRAGVSQMNERTDSLLVLAQLSRTNIKRETVDLSDMARDILKSLQQHDPDRAVQVEVQSSLVVPADPKLMRHLMTILLGNAWKFSAKNPAAKITVGSASASEGEAHFFIQDTGAGFDMTYSDKLFGAFQRLHSTSEFAGAGIGLAMARRIVTRHGGRIWADSAPGKGARFCFTLGPGGRTPTSSD